MSAPLDEQYLEWLYSKVSSVRMRNRSRSHWELLGQLFRTEFVWYIHNDANRARDGQDLRYEFVDECRITADPAWFDVGCSMLELIYGLSRRLSFEAEGEPRVWFWKLLENVGLTHITDDQYDALYAETIRDTMDRIIHRQYNRKGEGGLFPLRYPPEDQRNVELWYQLNAYVVELG